MNEEFASFEFVPLGTQSVLTIIRDALVFVVLGILVVLLSSKLPYGALFPTELTPSQKELSFFVLAGLTLVVSSAIFIACKFSTEKYKCPKCRVKLSKAQTEYEDFGEPETLYNRTNTRYQKMYHYLETRYFCEACHLENKVVVVLDRNSMIE